MNEGIAGGRRPLGRLIVTVAAICAGLLACAGTASSLPMPAVFDVGAASVNINPDTPQYISGYGYKGGPTTNVHDPLEVRAFVVSNGTDASAFVVADLTGWFSAYQGNLEPYGITHVREAAAAELEAAGLTAGRGSVIVSSTHTHSAPTTTGIWGKTDPAYMQKLRDAAVKAVHDAAADMKPSEIWTANGNVRSFIWQNGQGTNHPDGFSVDDQLPIMWARDPDSGATNALYANVPNHPDQFNGADNVQFSADWPGYARAALDDLNGGTSVIAAGTLGRQEPPGDVDEYSEVIPQGEFVVNAIQRAMAQATPLTDDTVAGTESYMDTPADNANLLPGIALWGPTGGACIDAVQALHDPASQCGPVLQRVQRPHRHVRALRAHRRPPLLDQSGRGVPRGQCRDRQFGEQRPLHERRGNGRRHARLLLPARRLHRPAVRLERLRAVQRRAEPGPGQRQPRDGQRRGARFCDHPHRDGVRAPRRHRRGQAGSCSSIPIRSSHRIRRSTSTDRRPSHRTGRSTVVGDIAWDFGDGTTGTTASKERFDHTFPGPGTYDVTATVTGSNAATRSWTQTIVIDPPLAASAELTYRSNKKASLSVTSNGRAGHARLRSMDLPGRQRGQRARRRLPGQEGKRPGRGHGC